MAKAPRCPLISTGCTIFYYVFKHSYYRQRSCSSNSSPSSSTTIHRKLTEPIISGVIGGLILISLLLALFFFNRRRNNRRSQALSEMSYNAPSPDVVTPFIVSPSNPTSTFLPQIPRTILQMDSLFLLSQFLANSLKKINSLISRARPFNSAQGDLHIHNRNTESSTNDFRSVQKSILIDDRRTSYTRGSS